MELPTMEQVLRYLSRDISIYSFLYVSRQGKVSVAQNEEGKCVYYIVAFYDETIFLLFVQFNTERSWTSLRVSCMIDSILINSVVYSMISCSVVKLR